MGKVDYISQVVIGVAIVYTTFYIMNRVGFINTNAPLPLN
jgi:hypothetical protein